MKYWQRNSLSITRAIPVLLGLALCVCSVSIIAAEYEGDDVMMHKLFEFHSKLAKQGNLESVTRLGVMYERGEGVAKNRKKAIELYQFAVKGGYKPAKELLANLKANKSNTSKQSNTTDSIRVPMPKRSIATGNATIRKQEELQDKLEQEQAAAAAAREELDRLLQSKQAEEEKQQKLLEEIQSVKQAQEQLAQERAKAEALRREMEQLRKQQEAAAVSKKQDVVVQDEPEQKPVEQTVQVEEKKAEPTKFSSNPCNTPAARFMSTCN